jgi:biotin transporter BioY
MLVVLAFQALAAVAGFLVARNRKLARVRAVFLGALAGILVACGLAVFEVFQAFNEIALRGSGPPPAVVAVGIGPQLSQAIIAAAAGVVGSAAGAWSRRRT